MNRPTPFYKVFTSKPTESQNKKDLLRDLKQCYSIQQLILIRQLLRYSAADFTPEEFLEFLHEIYGRHELLEYIDQNFLGRFTVGEVISRFRVCSHLELHALWLYLKMNSDNYTKNQQELFAKAFCKRNDQIGTPPNN